MIDRLLSLPGITAVGRLIDGYTHEGIRIGLCVDTHNKLSDLFGEAGIEVAVEPSISKKIRATLNRANKTAAEHAALQQLIQHVCDPRHYHGRNHVESVQYLNHHLRPDGFEVREIGNKFRLVSTTTGLASTALSEKARALDLDSVNADFERAINEADRDPADAITAACSTVESVCKCILDEMGMPYPANKDIKGLIGEVAKHLNLSPGRKDLPAEWEQDIRQILSGLFSVIGGIGALRTHAGDAHGKGKRYTAVDARIARLAIHAASTVSLFYIETWEKICQ